MVDKVCEGHEQRAPDEVISRNNKIECPPLTQEQGRKLLCGGPEPPPGLASLAIRASRPMGAARAPPTGSLIWIFLGTFLSTWWRLPPFCPGSLSWELCTVQEADRSVSRRYLGNTWVAPEVVVFRFFIFDGAERGKAEMWDSQT